jgi:hypothetical protein
MILCKKENEMKYVEENSRIWDKRAENNDRWSTVVTADKHFAPYLYDASKAIKIVVK